MVMSGQSVNQTTLFLGGLDLLSAYPVLSAHAFASNFRYLGVILEIKNTVLCQINMVHDIMTVIQQ